MRTSHFIFMLLLSAVPANAQKTPRYTVCGHVRDSLSAEGLNGATVHNRISMAGTCVKKFGFYRLILPEGNVELVYSYAGYNEQTVSFDLRCDTVIDINLAKLVCLQEAVVGGCKTCIQETAQISANLPEVPNTPSPMPYHAPESASCRNINPLSWE